MRDTPGIQKACEFRYSCLDDNKNEVRVRNVMRTREVSEDPEEEMRTHDIYKRESAYGKICNLCTRYKQRPMYHKKEIEALLVIKYAGIDEPYRIRNRLWLARASCRQSISTRRL